MYTPSFFLLLHNKRGGSRRTNCEVIGFYYFADLKAIDWDNVISSQHHQQGGGDQVHDKQEEGKEKDISNAIKEEAGGAGEEESLRY